MCARDDASIICRVRATYSEHACAGSWLVLVLVAMTNDKPLREEMISSLVEFFPFRKGRLPDTSLYSRTNVCLYRQQK